MSGAMHVTRWGDSGSQVVLVHGGAQGTDVAGETNFSKQKPLSEHWQLVLPDRPGHGSSPDPSRPDDAQADGALIAELLGERSHLLGHSFGGAVALAAAAKRPESVRSLTLIEPAMFQIATDIPVVRKQIFAIVRTMVFSLSAVSRARKTLKLLGIPPEVRGDTDPAVLARLGKALKKLKLPGKGELLAQFEVVRRAGIPVFVISGGWNPAFEALCDRIAKDMHGRRLVIPSGHHFPQLIADQFNPAFDAFLRDSETAGR
jgi:pimeloyl-ACP methyl ester carboxylesterase